MALQAEAVHVAAYEQTRIRRSVRKMARGTALCLDRRVLVDEWSECLDMALGANGVLGCTRPKEVRLEGAVRIMTVGALQQPFVDLVVERLRKSGLDVRMTLIAECRLLRPKHLRLRYKLVGAVAARTTDQSLTVGGPLEVGVGTNVARQALLIHLFRRCLCELKDIARDAAALDMGLTRSVAAFACHAFAAVFEGQLRMRIIAKTLHFGLMARCANFCSDEVGCLDHLRLLGWTGLLLDLSSGIHRPSQEPGEQDEDRNTEDHTLHPNPPVNELVSLFLWPATSGGGTKAASGAPTLVRLLRLVSAHGGPNTVQFCTPMLATRLTGTAGMVRL
jgi:hypothetical protein